MHVVQFNVALFERYFCLSGMTDNELLERWRKARAEDAAMRSRTSEEANASFKVATGALLERRREERREARRQARRQARIEARLNGKVGGEN